MHTQWSDLHLQLHHQELQRAAVHHERSVASPRPPGALARVRRRIAWRRGRSAAPGPAAAAGSVRAASPPLPDVAPAAAGLAYDRSTEQVLADAVAAGRTADR